MLPKIIQMFPKFYFNPTILRLAKNKNWSVSHPEKKIPLHMGYLQYFDQFQSFRGASPYDPDSMADLHQCIEILNGAPINHAYFLDSSYDSVMILDIEPSATDETKQKLLQTPCLYAETSMSGSGYHLILPLPKSYFNYGGAEELVALKSEDNTYEILLKHWVTFTRNALDDGQYVAYDQTNPEHIKIIDDLFMSLLQNKRESKPAAHFDLDDFSIEHIPNHEFIMEIMTKANVHNKDPEDFENDLSRYEASFMFTKLNRLTSLFHGQMFTEINFEPTQSDYVALLYHIATKCLPHRQKHDEYRRIGSKPVPWLAYQAYYAVSRQDRPKNNKNAAA